MKYLDIAIELVKESGRIQMDHFGKIHQVEYKGITNIVTEVDKKCEKVIVDKIKKEFPTHNILAEESGKDGTSSEYRWIIDPLDGTVNYTHGYPFFATSVALEYKKEIIAAAVFEPNRKELFYAEKGGGTFLNNRRIRVSKTAELQKALLDTGFAYNVSEGELRNNLVHFGDFLTRARAIRRDGAAAADLCYVACGRFDGFWELFLKPWDIAAGQLLVSEAGGNVSSFDGSPLDIYGTEILATNGAVHGQMVDVLCQKQR